MFFCPISNPFFLEWKELLRKTTHFRLILLELLKPVWYQFWLTGSLGRPQKSPTTKAFAFAFTF